MSPRGEFGLLSAFLNYKKLSECETSINEYLQPIVGQLDVFGQLRVGLGMQSHPMRGMDDVGLPGTQLACEGNGIVEQLV